MEKAKLQYPRNFYTGLKNFCDKPEFQSYHMNFDYLDYHNTICPRCQKEMKVSNGEVKNIGAYGLTVFKKKEMAIPYMICKSCSNKIQKEPAFLKKKHSELLDNYVLSIIEPSN